MKIPNLHLSIGGLNVMKILNSNPIKTIWNVSIFSAKEIVKKYNDYVLKHIYLLILRKHFAMEVSWTVRTDCYTTITE